MAFDPREYLKSAPSSESAPVARASSFDPAAYLNEVDRGNIINTDVPTVVGTRPNAINPQPQQRPRTVADYAQALFEVPATIVTGAAAPFIGVGKGIYQNVTQGTNLPVDRPELAQEFTYQPRSPVAQEAVETLASGLEQSKLPPFIPMAGRTAAATRQSGRTAAPIMAANLPSFDEFKGTVQTAPNRIAQLLREREAPLSGVGAAEVPEYNQRLATAQSLRVPVPLTKGQATRDLGLQQFEAEIAKTYPQDVGKPLIDRKLLQNERVLQNFDAFVDATGAQKAGEMNLYEVGKVVDKALVGKANQVKKQIGEAYKAAREAGETSQLIDAAPIKNYLDGLRAEEINAPVITSAKIKLADLTKDGKISINDLEEVRKMVNRVSGSTPTNMEFGKQIKNQIDSATADKGGELYQKARKLRENYAREFENVGVVDKLLSKKSGTTDRAVALEDVFGHAVLKGSADDLRSIGRTLKKAGPDGEQAWRELQGQTIEHMKSAVTRNIQRDQAGNPIVSPKQFDTVVRNLDADGKLDYLFGKKGAQEIRDLRDTAIAVYSPVSGINQSNTSAALTQALDRITKHSLSKVPLLGSAFDIGSEVLEKRRLGKQVEQSLEFTPDDIAKELRKGK